MSQVLIAGIGNVLLGDDGVGPFVIRLLESQYDFPASVSLADLGTPALDLPAHLAGADAVILVDSAKLGAAAGHVRIFRKQEILRIPVRTRIDPHSPPLRESLAVLELMGAMPGELTLIGMQGEQFEPGARSSRPVEESIPHVIDAVRRELHRLHISCSPKMTVRPPGTGRWARNKHSTEEYYANTNSGNFFSLVGGCRFGRDRRA